MNFNPGDLVFAKVRGFPPWPAKVTCSDVAGGGEKYVVTFYGTLEFSNISSKNLLPYAEVYKEKYGVNSKSKKGKFAKAIYEIENNPDSIEPNVITVEK